MSIQKTLNLPKTDLPMRANLPQREPQWLDFWRENKIYEKAQEGKEELFILHDGPPFSNGNIHMGHAINKILKDIVVKFQWSQGKRAPYVPGWDNHGLPTEILALKKLAEAKEAKDPLRIRKLCRELASHFVALQSEQFQRLGILGRFQAPYGTMHPSYEAKILEVFFTLYDRSLLTVRKKPVHWCPSCETALAEAEIEYEELESPSVIVSFPFVESADPWRGAHLLIWTTTPWTLPANVAVALHPDLEYALVAPSHGEGATPPLLLARVLLEKLQATLPSLRGKVQILGIWKGRELEGLHYQRPFAPKSGQTVLAEYVSSETGTGLVHIAPGHGEEDYQVGLAYHLEMLSPVDSKGRYTEEFPLCAKEPVLQANDKILDVLKRRGGLLLHETLTHPYPTCWRCHSPVLFRATTQWFYQVNKVRKEALHQVEKVDWIPEWGEARIRKMMEDRPDWCLSRQRAWGVFIPQLICPTCGKREITTYRAELLARVRQEGSDWWFEQLEEPGTSCASCGASPLQRGRDILDVWFDSGCSSLAVLDEDPELRAPADLYLEGSDQHRGWFQQSLWVRVGTHGEAPYAQVLTHGFVVDEKGRKMSKSEGNVVDPLEMAKKYGADVLRLWVSFCDYRSDIKVSEAIVQQVVEVYKKIRYTLRFLLSNLFDFQPSLALPEEELEETDIYLLEELNALIQAVQADYAAYNFHTLAHRIHFFCVHTLSNFYLDITKDRLYTYPPSHTRRRAAQTVYAKVLENLLILLMPILSFTAEEIYQKMSWREKGSLFLCPFPTPHPLFRQGTKTRQALPFRNKVFLRIEELKKEGKVNESLACSVAITTENPEALDPGFLREILRVAEVRVDKGSPEITVLPSGYPRCARCWNYKKDVKNNLCAFCEEIVNSKLAR